MKNKIIKTIITLTIITGTLFGTLTIYGNNCNNVDNNKINVIHDEYSMYKTVHMYIYKINNDICYCYNNDNIYDINIYEINNNNNNVGEIIKYKIKMDE